MQTETVAAVAAAGSAIAAAGISLIALPFTVRAANASKAQTDLQIRAKEEASQPYVWVDIRTSNAQGYSLNFVLGNAGPSVATNVRVRIDPPLPMTDRTRELTSRGLRRLADGVSAVAPGRTIEWPLGGSPELLTELGSQPYEVTIDASGPYGPTPTLTYVLDLSDFRESIDAPAGTLHRLTRAVEAVDKTIAKASKLS